VSRTVYVDAPGPKKPSEPLIEHEGEWFTRSAVASNYARHYCVGGVFCTKHDAYLAEWKRINMEHEPVPSESELIRRGVEANKRPLRNVVKVTGAYEMWGYGDE
jgi:hypothetical protein